MTENATAYYNLKFLIQKNGYNQKDVANALNMKASNFSAKLNRTRGRDFTLAEAKAISKFLNVPIDLFFD